MADTRYVMMLRICRSLIKKVLSRPEKELDLSSLRCEQTGREIETLYCDSI